MIQTNAFDYINVLDRAADAAWQRNEAISNNIANVDLSRLRGRAYVDYANYSYRLDGNNVDIENENVMLAENQLKYQGLISSINQEFTNLKTVMK